MLSDEQKTAIEVERERAEFEVLAAKHVAEGEERTLGFRVGQTGASGRTHAEIIGAWAHQVDRADRKVEQAKHRPDCGSDDCAWKQAGMGELPPVPARYGDLRPSKLQFELEQARELEETTPATVAELKGLQRVVTGLKSKIHGLSGRSEAPAPRPAGSDVRTRTGGGIVDWY